MADRSGYIGRAPGDSSIIVARQTHSPTGVQTDFTFASGYTVGYIDAYLNGIRLINAEDYTATDGTTVGLTSAANNGDILELVAYKAFNLANVAAATGNFSVGNNLTVTDNLTVSGDATSIVNITGTAGTFTDLTVTDQFTGNATGTAATFTKITATDQFSGNISGIAATFTGPVTIGGTLTYEDATNVDSVGLVTARTGVRVTAGGMVVTAGVSTFAAALDVNGELDVDGQTDLDNLVVAGVSTFAAIDINGSVLTLDADGDTTITADTDDRIDIAFGGNDRLTLSTGLIDLKNDGSQSALRLYCESDNAHYAALQAPAHSAFSGDITLTLPATTDTLVARTTTDTLTNKTLTSPNISTPTMTGGVGIADSIFHTGDDNTAIRFPAADTFSVETAGSERLRITSAGKVLVGFTTERSNFYNTSTINPKVQIEGTNYSDSALSITSNGASNNRNPYSILLLSRSRGTDFASNTVVADTDVLGAVDFQGNDGTQFVSAAAIEAIVDGAPGADDMPGALTFLTTVDGASTPTEKLRITSAGSVGIGVTNPVAFGPTLQVSGTDPALLLQDTANAVDYFGMNIAAGAVNTWYDDASAFVIHTASAISGAGLVERLRITSDGSVGTGGLIASGGNLAVNSTIRSQNSSSNISYIGFTQHTGNTTVGSMFSYMGGDGRSTGYLNFSTNDTERLRITSGGEIGIGNTSPESYASDGRNLVIGNSDSNSASGISLVSGTGGYSNIYFADGTSGSALYSGAIAYDHSDNRMDFWTAGDRRVRITSAGYVGINTITPAYQLSTYGTGAVRNEIVCTNNNDAGAGIYMKTLNAGSMVSNATIRTADDGFLEIFTGTTSDAQRACISGIGSVGIVATNPRRALHVDGEILSRSFINGNNERGIMIMSSIAQGDYDNLGVHIGTIVENAGNNGYGMEFYTQSTYLTGKTLKMTIAGNGTVTIPGTLSKGGGSFKIPHPLPELKDTNYLAHSFIEGPQCDNIYRGKVDLVDGTASINIDTVSSMTDGTFVVLNRDIQCFTSNETGWTAVKGSVSGNILNITAQDNTCTDTISWMVVGERQDPTIKELELTDDDGKLIVEPLKETIEPGEEVIVPEDRFV